MAARPTGSGSNHSWSPEQISFLREHAADSGADLVAAFRAKFKKFDGSDQSIKGRRYAILNRSSSPEGRVAAIEAKLVAAKERVEQLEAELVEAQASAAAEAAANDEPRRQRDALEALSMTDLRAEAKAAGVTPAGRKKADFVDALIAA